MCRIDALFSNRHLDEKNDPQERFLQALEEYGIDGYLQELLIKHISENWIDIFSNPSNLETALENTQKQNTELEKCLAIAFYERANIRHRLTSFPHDETYRKSLLFKLLVDAADTYSSASPFRLFKSGIYKHFRTYCSFVHWFYGEEYFFTEDFFNDNSLSKVSDHERAELLWSCFYQLAPQFNCVKDNEYSDSLLEQLALLAASTRVSNSYTKDGLAIIRGLEFIKTWVKCDSEMGLIAFDTDSNFYHNSYDSPLKKLSFFTENTAVSELCRDWLHELDRILIINTDLHNTPAPLTEQWAKYVDDFFTYINRNLDLDQSQTKKSYIQSRKELNKLSPELGTLQLQTWIKWCIEKDFHNILSSQGSSALNSEKWVCDEYIEEWKELFLNCLYFLSPEHQLRILSAQRPICRGESNEFCNEFSKWWDECIGKLVEKDNFPNQLIPDWTITALYFLDDKKILPFIDKSIGLLRRRISESQDSKELAESNKKIYQLLNRLDVLSPSKSFQHRWLLMRVSAEPLSDDSLSVKHKLDHWYPPISDLITKIAAELYNKNIRNAATTDTPKTFEQITYETYLTYTQELAEFCLKRLRLRKGEKIVDEKYTSEQVTEISTLWRQGYLKVLTELGCDLNGKVHKAVYFTKLSDPNSDVREVASECYKAVRRNSKINQSIIDLKRAVIAAEWWLLLCQRSAVGEQVTEDAAVKTRRNLMRNP